MKIFKTNRVIYKVELNADGTLKVFREYFSTKKMANWEKDGRLCQNAGQLITQEGGIDALLSKCEDIDDVDKFVAEINEEKKSIRESAQAMRLTRQLAEQTKAEEAYKKAFNQDLTECNASNIYILLCYLNTKNWGTWSIPLPKMTIGYACHQYDCDGKIATTIKLDKPVMVGGRMGTMYQYGAPRGHLVKYDRIVDWSM